MTVESFLQYWTAHNESIIQWLLLTIVLLTIMILSRLILGKPSDQFASIDVSSKPLNETLGKILEETAAMKSQLATGVTVAAGSASGGGGSGASAGGSAGGGAGSVEFENAKAEVEKKEKEIAALKVQLQDMPKGGDATQYLSKIKELEGKLSEYEILEDDIADLSLFKEENARLKTELEALKGQAQGMDASAGKSDFVGEFEAAIQTATNSEVPPVVAAAVAAAPEPEFPLAPLAAPTPAPVAPAPSPDDMMGLEPEPASEPMPEPAPAPAAPVAADPTPAIPVTSPGVPPTVATPDITEDILAEFSKESSANEIISQMANSVTAPSSSPPPPPPPMPKPAAATATATAATSSDSLDIQVDSNKMIEEIAALSSNPTDADGSSLEGEPDMDKIISEVGQLQEKKA